MKSLLRKIARLGRPVSSKLIKFWYYITDGFYSRTDYCEICGLPIRHDNKFSTIWADAEILNLVGKNYYVYPICKHCREHETWDKIYQAYSHNWTEIFRTTDKVGFCWGDIQKALEEDKKLHGIPGNIKKWEKILIKAYKNSPKGEYEFCGFKKGEEIKEVLEAVKRIGKDIITIVYTEKRTSIRFIKYGKKKKRQERRIIILPATNDSPDYYG